MKRLFHTLAVFVIVMTLAACNSIAKKNNSQTGLGCRAINDSLISLTGNLEIPEHLYGDTPYRLESDFDPNQYFTILDHLKMKKGYQLDYVYLYDEMGGSPQLYSRALDAAQIKSVDEYRSIAGLYDSGDTTYAGVYDLDYLKDVELDFSPESYFQYMLLSRYGDQFYLFWHSNYQDQVLMCDKSDIANVEKGMSSFGIQLPQDVKDKIVKSNLTPSVKINDNDVTVRWVEFSKWGGLEESVFTLSKGNPVTVLDLRENILAEYNCGIAF